MSDDIKNKPERPAQEPLNVGGETKCKNCEQPKSAHLVSGHIYCPISLGRACWYEPVDAATPAPSYPSELPASKLSWPQLPEPSAHAVEAARRIIRFFRANPRVMRETVVGRIIDDVFESAPSQPAGAREWLFEHAPLAWNGPNRVAHIVSWMEAYARQQTAAKDAEIGLCFDVIFGYVPEARDEHGKCLSLTDKVEILGKQLEAAERERDSLLLLLEQSQKENALLYEELTQLKARIKELMNHLSSSGT